MVTEKADLNDLFREFPIVTMTMIQVYQPSGEGGAHSPPATPHRLQNPKWPPGGPKMAEGVWKGVYP